MKRNFGFLILVLIICLQIAALANQAYLIRGSNVQDKSFTLQCPDQTASNAYEMAIDVVQSNIKPWQKGLLKSQEPVLIAGRGYSRPWTRDASYNSYFALGFIWPEISKNTLLSVLTNTDGQLRISGQYWDCIGWSLGAWQCYCCSGDKEFLNTAYKAITNTLEYFRKEQFDPETGLYCGPGWSDGIAGYPAPYDQTKGSSFILDYANKNPHIDKIRMKALSTNCLYYRAHTIAINMARQLGIKTANTKLLSKRANALKKAINKHLWNKTADQYGYYLDRNNKLETSTEALGQSFAILFGIASEKQAQQIFKNQYVSNYGIVCNWPKFKRFKKDQMPRHCAAIWPQIQGFWALAAARKNNADALYHELNNLGKMALDSNDFREIYDPDTGKHNGGWQTDKQWESAKGQSWAATAYLAMIYQGVFGMSFEPDKITFTPIVKDNFKDAQLKNIKYRNMTLNIKLLGTGSKITSFKVNGKETKDHFIDANLTGIVEVEINLK